MDNKIIAIAVAAILIIAGVGLALSMGGGSQTSDKEINVLARVNSEGSGMYLRSSENPDDYLEVLSLDDKYEPKDGDKVVENERYKLVFHTEAWGGKVFGTPGLATIQHVHLSKIVTTMLDMEFVQYKATTELKDDVVYFSPDYPSFGNFKDKAYLTGAFNWEVQYSLAIDNGCVGLFMTDQIFPEHTCCLLAGNERFTSANPDVTVRFIAAYIESVNTINDIIKNKVGTPEYDELVKLGVEKTGLATTAAGANNPEQVVKDALQNITYLYGDDDNAADPLSALKTDLTGLVDEFAASGALKVKPTDLGFKETKDFVNRFVNSSYLKSALKYTPVEYDTKVTVNVAAIAGDIHQIAVHFGMEKNIFDKYGISVNVMPASNGPGVATALQNGSADFGLIGAPPITTITLNSKLITA